MDLKLLKWPENVLEMQKGWIGKTLGYELTFKINNDSVQVFTTKPETIMGVSFLALAPEHDLVAMLATPEEMEVIASMKNKSEISRKSSKNYIVLSKAKGIHPITNEELPIVVGEYVLMNVGFGCVMGVPAHDQRDRVLANELGFPIIKVLGEDGQLINSAEFTGLDYSEARKKISERISLKEKINYRMKDWLVSRQRYWGVPIPIVHCDTCGEVPETNLPLLLPKFEEKDEWIHTNCPCCGKNAKRESDTLDTFVDSSWYYLRYIDSNNSNSICNEQLAKKWAPVDIYIGGIEHAIMHLLYARFIHKVLKDENIVACNEPFHRLLTQGLVLGPTYKQNGRYLTENEARNLENVEKTFEKMSKSKKNGISPEEIMEEWGADTLRLAILFAAPSEKEIEWDGNLLKSIRKWLISISELKPTENSKPENTSKLVQDITKCMKLRKFHVAIARLMEYVHKIKKEPERSSFKDFLIMLYPFAPHISSELFMNHFHSDIRRERWPTN